MTRSVEGLLRNDPVIRRRMEWARWDRDDAIRERHPEVKRLQRERMRVSLKIARWRLHFLMKQARNLSDDHEVQR